MHPSLMEQVKRIMELTKENDLFRHKVWVLQNRNVNRKIKKKRGFFLLQTNVEGEKKEKDQC